MSIKIFSCILCVLAVISSSPSEGSSADRIDDALIHGTEHPDESPQQARTSRWNFSRGSLAPAELDADWIRMERKLQPYFGNVIDTIVVSGNTYTKRATIVREMATKQGERLEERHLQRDASYLKGMGFFSGVDISAGSVSPGHCRLNVEVIERPGLFMKYPYPVVNYDFEKGVSYGLRWRIKNFRGQGEELRIYAIKRRDKEHGGDITWQVPWLGGRRFQMRSNIFTYRVLEEPESGDFIKERTGASAYFSFPLSTSLIRQLWLGALMSFEWRNSRLTYLEDGTATADFYRQNFLAVGVELTYDSRDNRITPWRGMLGRIHATRFTCVHGLDQEYILYFAASYFYLPIGSLGTLVLALEGDIREGDLPSFFEMGIGSTRDLRGYADNDRRGRAKVLGTLQFRRPIYGPIVFNIPYIGTFDLALNAIAFIDNAALMDTINEVPDSRYDTTGGFGLEVISPIQDVMRLEIAGDGSGNVVFYLTSDIHF